MWILASPESSSSAASDTLRSVFQELINLWQTRYVALTNNACAESTTGTTSCLVLFTAHVSNHDTNIPIGNKSYESTGPKCSGEVERS
jgi:hypothetical protein